MLPDESPLEDMPSYLDSLDPPQARFCNMSHNLNSLRGYIRDYIAHYILEGLGFRA